MLEKQYVMAPTEAIGLNIPVLYRERLTVRIPFHVTPTMAAAAGEEILRDPKRYQVNKQHSLAEVFRASFLVAQRLREINPALFFELRDSFHEMNELESAEVVTLESTPTPA